MFSTSGNGQGLIYELTAPRTVQAFMVVLFSTVTAVLALRGEQAPELMGFALAGIIGYYFGTVNERRPVEVNGSSAARIASEVGKEVLFHVDRALPLVWASPGVKIEPGVEAEVGAEVIPPVADVME